jgi:hypothetical protein
VLVRFSCTENVLLYRTRRHRISVRLTPRRPWPKHSSSGSHLAHPAGANRTRAPADRWGAAGSHSDRPGPRRSARRRRQSFVQLDNIQSVAKTRFVKYVGALDAATMRAVGRKVILALGLEDAL